MEEVWLPIVENPKFGFVSNLGRVKNKHGKMRKPQLSSFGYLRIGFSGGRYTRFVHCVVADAFLGSRMDKQVNHKDGDKTNNAVFNLEYVTASQNTRHAYDLKLRVNSHRKPKIPHEDRYKIIERITSGESQRSVAASYGVNPSSLCVYLNGRKASKAHYVWRQN